MTYTVESLTPARIVSELNKYIISQHAAKRSVAIALRNRWRRQQITGDLQSEIMPNNIILIGPTGVGKTEIARRLSKLANAPFIKVEASKFTEVGYVGRDVESMIRELMNNAVNQFRHQMLEEVAEEAMRIAINKVLDILVPPVKFKTSEPERTEQKRRHEATKAKTREKLLSGALDERMIEIRIEPEPGPSIEILPSINFELMDMNISDMLSGMLPHKNQDKKRPMSVKDALAYYQERAANDLVNKDKVVETAKFAVENHGIVFIDELDKIAVHERGGGIDVSRSGVQRDLLPIVEGSTVPTKYGTIDTSHILFIAAGAFHTAKPSDLIPELQGRFPIRVELNSLTQDDFERILTEPENALTKQYIALFMAESVKLSFQPAAIGEIARYAALANDKMEDIGARRLHTIMNALLDEYLFTMPGEKLKKVTITAREVVAKLSPLIESEDLSRFIL
ncbi:MAG TPA: ATP-dependent protease ATPase subunit HslU [Candidatus Cloacimonadota bacterium]|nr:ATP-dependent protease ATPase subunit HslU [Candidatus Cloacimonadota bacterium]HPS38295.1 ATP-dependent protease ATPase subunit HslU [Candidatus Cloacimonadota bacterium]